MRNPVIYNEVEGLFFEWLGDRPIFRQAIAVAVMKSS